MSCPVTFAAATVRHASGAWGNRTHSAYGVVTIAGEAIDWNAYRYFDKSAAPGSRTTVEVVLTRRNGNRELTAAKWEAGRVAVRAAFKASVSALAAGELDATAAPSEIVSPAAPAAPVDLWDVHAAAVATRDAIKVSDLPEYSRAADAVAVAYQNANRAAPCYAIEDGCTINRADMADARRELAERADAGEIVTADGIESGLTGPDWEPDAQSLYYAQRVDTPALMAFGPSRVAALGRLAVGMAEPVTRPAPAPVLVSNTSRACYWRTPGGFIATGPDVRAADVRDNGAAYPRLDALMRLKGETADTIARTLSSEVLRLASLSSDAPADSDAPAAPLAVVTGRSVDGTEYLTACGWSGDRRAALVMTWPDAVEIAQREETAAAATRSPDCGTYQIKAAPFTGPALYTLADYLEAEREAAALSALYGEAN